jgi:hypothetical protein
MEVADGEPSTIDIEDHLNKIAFFKRTVSPEFIITDHMTDPSNDCTNTQLVLNTVKDERLAHP